MTEQHLPLAAKSYFAAEIYSQTNKDILVIFSSEEDALKAYKQAAFYIKDTENLLYFPSLDTLPYDRISPNQNTLAARAEVLTYLATTNHKKILITNAANLLAKLPPPIYFTKSSLTLLTKMKLTSKQLAEFLTNNSFIRNDCAIDSGEFAVRGEIIDIVLPEHKGFRINFSWDQIETIKQFDIDTQISIEKIDKLLISPASELILNPETIASFKDNYLKNFGVNHTNLPLYNAIIEGRRFPGLENLLPLFYHTLSNLADYLKDPVIIYDYLSIQSIFEYAHSYKDLYNSRIESNKIKANLFYPALPPEQLCFPGNSIKELLENDKNILITQENLSYIRALDNISASSFIENKTIFDKLFEIIKEHNKKIPIIFCPSKSQLERLKNIITGYSLQYLEVNKLLEAKIGIINLALLPLDTSFYNEKYLIIAAQDIIGGRAASDSKSTAKRKLKNILLELDNLNEGELIVHKDHGIGQFINIETLEISGKPHDFLKILYADNDKLYIPVENIEVIKKYGNTDTELSRLGAITWQKSKARIKNRITEVAQQLLTIAAKRKLTITSPLEYDLDQYEKFCRRFPYTETDDQLKAIEDIKQDFNFGILMDRLLCGDVGFGKTEVALRAIYMVAKSKEEPKAQVAIVVPTTILCKQHYSRFLERFKDCELNIVQLSSLVSNSEAKIIKEQIKDGTANIIVGTHALLSKTIEFHNLKLLVIDEEQHFGVGQKEFLKELKSNVHVLSISATPIPRTLQMSMVGLKELSIIATPPLDRLEVRTTVMPYDPIIIRDALLREHFRGGRSFYVVPRIKDIPLIEQQLQAIVPELKYKVAHGGMSAAKVDNTMSEFYDGGFDILVSTTIIESGIDIAHANTMIIHKADTLGLSQLYQLKGRIGRSKVRGYAYLTLASDKQMTKHAVKRLEIMQNSCGLGAGFTIASHDMDIRGFGNLLGAEQSGQIKEVGIELYQEMLDEQLAYLKNEPGTKHENFVPTINLGLPVFIPDHYIPDSSLKLAIYRRIASLLDHDEVENFKDEMIDRFGSIPTEFSNLLDIVKIKQRCIKLNIENLDLGERGFVMKFNKEVDSEMVIAFVSRHQHHAKIKPDNKLIFINPITGKNIIDETNALLEGLYSMN